MKTIGFPISHKENERRRAIVPSDITNMEHPEMLCFEKGYGEVLGIEDDEYTAIGCKCADRATVLASDVICDPKVGDGDYLGDLHDGQSVFGWVHATQNLDITQKLINNGLTAYAWEKMYDRGRHIFWRNNELAGEAAVMHAFQCYGRMPYEVNVAVLGRGNTARGAMKVLNMLGAKVMQYDRCTESLLRNEIDKYEVIVNCILWDPLRTDHIIYRNDLARMKHGAMIIDVSCDRAGGIETSVPTTIENPTYIIDGITHYVVDHTPALFFKTFTYNNSEVIVPYLEELITNKPGTILKNAMVIEHGKIVDPEITKFQNK